MKLLLREYEEHYLPQYAQNSLVALKRQQGNMAASGAYFADKHFGQI
jgi:hypothetical protein